MNPLRLLVLSAVLLSAPAWAGGGNQIGSALEGQLEKRVTVMLRSGQELTGTVKAVDSNVVKLAELSGKEFFDATVRLDSVDAVVVRARSN